MARAYVRLARSSDAATIAQIQVNIWQVAYASILPYPVLASAESSIEQIAAHWKNSIETPPTHHHRTLVAIDESPTGEWITGFASSGPDEDEHSGTVMINSLLVAPRWGRRGHGSRLLNATIDLAKEAAFSQATTWLLESDTASRRFFSSAGWEPDNLTRELDMNGAAIEELHYTTALS